MDTAVVDIPLPDEGAQGITRELGEGQRTCASQSVGAQAGHSWLEHYMERVEGRYVARSTKRSWAQLNYI